MFHTAFIWFIYFISLFLILYYSFHMFVWYTQIVVFVTTTAAIKTLLEIAWTHKDVLFFVVVSHFVFECNIFFLLLCSFSFSNFIYLFLEIHGVCLREISYSTLVYMSYTSFTSLKQANRKKNKTSTFLSLIRKRFRLR